MLKLKDILKEQSEFVKLIIQTPAPQEILNIVRETKPRGVAFILKAVSNLGAEPDLDTIVNLLKLDTQFGTGTIWATETNDDGTSAYIYIFGKDQKDAQRKTKFNVLVVPRQYIYDKILGKESSEEEKVAAINNSLVSKYSIGDAAVFFEEEIDKLAKDVAPLLDKEQIKTLKDENEQLKKALNSKSEPVADKTTVVSSDSDQDTTPVVNPFKENDVITITKATTVDTWPVTINAPSDKTKQKLTLNINDRLKYYAANEFTDLDSYPRKKIEYGFMSLYTDPSIDVSITGTKLDYYIKISDLVKIQNEASPSKIESLKKRLQDEPIKLDTTSDDVKYIQDLMYRIGMASPKLADKNDVKVWQEFRDAKSQFGTYGTRTKNFIDAIKKSKGVTDTGSDITAEVFQLILDSGKNVGITESRKTYFLDKFIQEQFDITADVDKDVTSKTKTSITTKDKINKKQYDDRVTYGSFHALGTPTEKLNRTTPIKYGSKGEEVKRMQAALNAIMELMKESGSAATWLTKLKTDGDFGPSTRKIHDSITTTPMNLQDWKTTLQNYYENWEKSQKQTSNVSAQDIKDSRLMEKIWQNIYDVLSKEPEKYFYKYKGYLNDYEDDAADWILAAFRETWGADVNRMKNSKNAYISRNAQNIIWVVNEIANKLIRAGYTGWKQAPFYYLDKNNQWKKQLVKFTWNYM